MQNALEFSYGLKTRHAIIFMAIFTGLPALLYILTAQKGESPAELLKIVLSVRWGFLVLLVPVLAVAIPFVWYRSRGEVLRLTDSELKVGKVVLPVSELDSIRLFNQGPTRSMIVQAGKRKAGINQMYLPSPKAFDEILQALTNIHSARRELESAPPKRPSVLSRPGVSPGVGRSAACEAIRQKLRLAVMYDEAKIDRLVGIERQREPGATDEQLHAAAYERWCRDNRT